MSIADVLTLEYLADGRRACWLPHLRGEFNRPYMRRLRRYLEAEESNCEVFPQPECVFEALEETTLEEVKVVIIGQDPYPKPGQAHGLAFSTLQTKRPKSLRNVFAEVCRNMNRRRVPAGHNCLTPWARQGVLLLNRVLTVRRGCAGAHERQGWEHFTDRVVESISEHREHVVFMLWGKQAKEAKLMIDARRHKVLSSKHPTRGLCGSEHFSRANQYLEAHSAKPIDWLDACRRPQPKGHNAVPPLTAADAADEAQWDRAFAASIPQLNELAAEAARDRHDGLTVELDPSQL